MTTDVYSRPLNSQLEQAKVVNFLMFRAYITIEAKLRCYLAIRYGLSPAVQKVLKFRQKQRFSAWSAMFGCKQFLFKLEFSLITLRFGRVNLTLQDSIDFNCLILPQTILMVILCFRQQLSTR